METVAVRCGTVEIPGFGWMAFGVSDLGLVQTASFFSTAKGALDGLNMFMDSRKLYSIRPEPLVDAAWWEDACIQFFRNGWTASDPGRIPLDTRDWKPFQKAVFLTLRDNIGPGETISYGELAGLAGFPGAARAVGTAMSQNMCGPFIPCHRVIGSRGRLGGFSGSGGLDQKRKLLELEGVRFRE